MTATVYENGTIYPLTAPAQDGAQPTATTLAVADGKIVAVGSSEQCRAALSETPQTVDLEGATIIPGLTDSHIHLGMWARSRIDIDLHAVASMEQALTAVMTHCHTLAPGEWMRGGRWNYHQWKTPDLPTKHDLDSVTCGRPVALTSIDAHTMWLNSAALERVGIDAHTPDPIGGVIERDADGEPTGILRERAGELVTAALREDPAVPTELADILPGAIDELLSYGVTSIHDIDDAAVRDALTAMRTDGRLPLRVQKLIRPDELERYIAAGLHTGSGDEWLRIGPLKLFTDGALGSHTAEMSQDYLGLPGQRGRAVTDDDELADMIAAAAAARISVAAHAIGDQANHRVLNAFAAALATQETGAADTGDSPALRYRIEHAQYLQGPDVARLANLGIIASMQPMHCVSDIALNDQLIGASDLAAYAWRSLLSAGASLIFGSDAPTDDVNPWHGLQAATTRTRLDGTPEGGWHSDERLTTFEALRAYTATPAYASGEEHFKGVLAPGMAADFAVLAADPFQLDPEQLHRMSVLATVVGGHVQYSA